MKHPDRLHRPTPERTDPDRSFPRLFGAPPSNGPSASNGNGAASLNDVVSHSVDLGYRLIDDYIRQGERAARRVSERSVSPQTMVGDAQDIALRFAQHASALAAVWLEFLQVAAAGTGVPMAGNFLSALNPGAMGTGSAPRPTPSTSTTTRSPHDDRTRVRIEVAADQPTDVVLDLHPSATGRRLIVHALRATDPEKPHISDVHFQPESEAAPAALRIRIPSGQPSGTYNALILDEASSRPVGSISVSLTSHTGENGSA